MNFLHEAWDWAGAVLLALLVYALVCAVLGGLGRLIRRIVWGE